MSINILESKITLRNNIQKKNSIKDKNGKSFTCFNERELYIKQVLVNFRMRIWLAF